MVSVNEKLRDEAVRHAMALDRLNKGTLSGIVKILNESDLDLVQKIMNSTALDQGLTSIRSRRLKSLLDDIRVINRDAYDRLQKYTVKGAKDAGAHEIDFQKEIIERSLPIEWDVTKPDINMLAAIVNERPFEGKVMGEWFQDLERNKFDRMQGQIRMGLVEGETVPQIARRIRGTPAANYRDGVLEISKTHAETVVRTAINHTVNGARQRLYSQNKELIKGWQFCATLDSRTTLLCAGLDGQVFKLGEGPQPPRHPRCRSSSSPVVKSFRELGIDIDDFDESTRESMNGQVSAKETFSTWLKKQDPAFIREYLGDERAELFMRGKFELNQYNGELGKPLTLAQLREKEFKPRAKKPAIVPKGETPAQRAERERLANVFMDEYEFRLTAPDAQGHGIEKLDNLDKKAIHGYTRSIYGPVNKMLRKQTTTSGRSAIRDDLLPAAQAYVDTLVQALDKLPNYTEPTTRGMELVDTSIFKTGDTFVDPGFLSTSYGSGFFGNVKMFIKGKTGKLIERLSNYTNEKEVLFKPGTRFKILNVEQPKSSYENLTKVYMEEI